MNKLDLLQILDRIFALKPGEQEIIRKEIERIQREGSNDKNQG